MPERTSPSPDPDQPLPASSLLTRLPAGLPWILLATLAAAAFLHLGADFPNHSRWADDAAKFTDEGWYASGALNHHLTGHWLRPGDFNPMVTIPVWSTLLAAIFHFTGISLVIARAVAVVFLLGTVLAAGALVRRTHPRLPTVLMLLLLANPLLYFFGRSAILEPALLFFLLASAWAAYGQQRPSAPRLALSGALFVLAILTKSSAVFAAPALAYLLWFPHRAAPPEWRRSVGIAGATIALLYGLYYVLVVHTHPADVRVLYNENVPYLGVRSIQKAVRIIYRSFTWIDMLLFPLALAAVAASLARLRSLWRDPLFGYAVVFYVGYSGFLLLHFDAEPHYFAVLVFPVVLIVVLLLDAVPRANVQAGNVLAACVALAVAVDVLSIGLLLARPTYTMRDAAAQIRERIQSDPAATPLVIGHGAINETFYNGVPALDDIGTAPVAEKLQTAHPGWVLTWSDSNAIFTRPGVAEGWTFTPAGVFPVLDNPGRQALLLYRVRAAEGQRR